MTDWHEDEEFWEVIDLIHDLQYKEGTQEEVGYLIGFLGIDSGAHVLDLCCGVGRHSLEFARRGFTVTGVDRTSQFLKRANQQAKDEGLSVEFVHEDMRQFCRPDSFDAAINFFTSCGFFNDEENLRVLQNLHESLKPGGRLVMEMVGKEILARTFQERDWFRSKDGKTILLEEREIRDGWKWVDIQWHLIKGSERRERSWSLRVYSAGELEASLRKVGFNVVKLYGTVEGDPYDVKAKRLIAVAQK
ncbi:class I SAM-dependent methyltransferase [Acidobacteria bacterium AH-259-D05]|nr:class I SAM-dependent methyltransferase [Acidobacteria bacterium AH-259-D05]